MGYLEYMQANPFMTFIMICVVACAFHAPFHLGKRWIRHLDIKAHGWPTTPNMDSDGDIVHPDKDDD